ncbi:MAG TPA: metal-dependent hydrolase [Terriglobales bacterium]|nr:metal-dependent hydrolase [Terriglobales bacterium]
MEPLTHFLTGAVLSRAGFNRKTALATFTMTIGAEAADIDLVVNLRGPIYGFAHHRGITHSFVGVPLVALGVVAGTWVWHRFRRRFWPPKVRPGYPTTPRWGLLYLLAVLAGLSHILLDFTNSYGVRPFEPFSYRWYAWDIVFIIEPLLYVVLLGGLVVPAILRLVSEEVGARPKGPPGRVAAVLALFGMLLVWGVRDYQHRRAVTALQSGVYDGAEAKRVGAFPYPLNPFQWYAVVETENRFDRMLVNSLSGQVDPEERAQVRYKLEETPVTLAAKQSYLGRVYLDWSRFPVEEVQKREPPQPGYIVRFQDLRFRYPNSSRGVLSAGVVLDPELSVTEYLWPAFGGKEVAVAPR